jgi:hypothetical protein
MRLYFSHSFNVPRLMLAMRVKYPAQFMPHDVITLIIIIINNFKDCANWSVPRQLSSQLVMFNPF